MVVNESHNDSAYPSLVDIVKLCSKFGIELIVVQTPLRSDAVKIGNDYMNKYTSLLKTISSKEGFKFLDYSRLDGMGDEYYVNKTHLNVEGSKFFTKVLVSDPVWFFK